MGFGLYRARKGNYCLGSGVAHVLILFFFMRDPTTASSLEIKCFVS